MGEVHAGFDVLTALNTVETPVPLALAWYTVQELVLFAVAELATFDPLTAVTISTDVARVAASDHERSRREPPRRIITPI
jgi:hypothetical protein